MFQRGQWRFQRREQRFDNRYKPRVGLQVENNFHNQHYNAPASQGLNSSARDSDLKTLLRKVDESSATTQRGFVELGKKMSNIYNEMDEKL